MFYPLYIELTLNRALLSGVAPRPGFRPLRGRARRQKEGLIARYFKEGLFYIRYMPLYQMFLPSNQEGNDCI